MFFPKQDILRETVFWSLIMKHSLSRRFAEVRACALRMLRFAQAQNTPKPAFAWLADNRYLIENALSALSRDVRGKAMRACAPQLFSICKDALEKALAQELSLDEDALCALLSESAQALSERELACLPSALTLEALSLLASREKALYESADKTRFDEALARQLAFSVTALRLFSALDFSALHARLSPIERILSCDPAGAYAGMDEESRAFYRARVALLSKARGVSECALAEKVLALARENVQDERKSHVGYWLIEAPLGKKPPERTKTLYSVLILALPAVVTAALGLSALGFWALFAYPVVGDICIRQINRVFSRFLPRKPMLSMKPETRFPKDAKTMCVIAALAPDADTARTLARRLRDLALGAKGGENLAFGLLLDLKESDSAHAPSDGAILAAARNEIEALDRRYGGFYLFTRPRAWSESERRFIPRERKRGAIEALCAFLRGMDCEIRASRDPGKDFRYLALLDQDTGLQLDALSRAAAALRHPLNRAYIASGRVKAGHALMQPQLVRMLAPGTPFASFFGGPAGYDGYGAAASELYQDLLDETNFTGKGVVDIDAYLAVLPGALPGERVLSHDLVEGAYLRAGFCPQAEFFEGFPDTAAGFYAREHRWIRGDWQNLPFLFPKVRTESGARVKNPLPGHARARIADNLRRSLVPFFTFVCLFAGLIVPGAAALVFLALAVFLPDLLFAPLNPREIYASRIPGAFARAAGKAALSLVFLPKAAYTALDAALRALWRMGVSHRRLLQWRTAAQTDGAGKHFLSCALAFLPCPAAGAVLLALPGKGVLYQILRLILALLWLSAPITAYFVSRKPKQKENRPDAADREFLLAEAQRMYGYFRENVCEKTHFLPPDNVQLRPAQGVARRTSPTNIGLALLSFVCALDLGFEGTGAVLSRLDSMLTSLEGMEKWNGNLYNWYSTDTAMPLFPRRVSFVDSGNLLACLLALAQALGEVPDAKARALAERARTLADGMRLSPLYDPARKLFRIGFDAERGQFDENCYDLLESEARLASYVAVSRGEAGVDHWKRLGRPIGKMSRRRGLLSWSGTMFEYLMPSLFLPDFDASLLSESAHFALSCQKARIGAYPYGISESCFFAFDEEMNYQYKANGVQALGLGRGLDRETVLAPYAAFLTLALDVREACRNLRAFASQQMQGIWGFYEALDCTSAHLPEGCGAMPVRCFMAHHVGMSLLAAENALTEGIWQRRFMAIPEHAAADILLKERFPVGTNVRAPMRRQAKPTRRETGRRVLFSSEAGQCEGMTVLSNGGIRVLASERGVERVISLGRDLAAPDGVKLYLVEGGRVKTLTGVQEEEAEHGFRLTSTDAEYTARYGEDFARTRVWVSAQEKAARISLTIESAREAPAQAYAVLAFLPVLEEERAYSAHPAFSKLFLSVCADAENGLLHISRRTRTGGDGMCACLACAQQAIYETARERAFAREGEAHLALVPRASSRDDGAPDPACVVYVPLTLERGKPQTVDFALACAPDAESAAQAAKSTLSEGLSLASRRMDAILDALSMDAGEAAQAFSVYLRALRSQEGARAQERELAALHEGREFLWRFGISGDFPLLAASDPGEAPAEKLLRAQMLRYLCGAYCDLALLIAPGGYRRGAYALYRDMLRTFGGETLLAARAGVHLIDEENLPGDAKSQLFALADCLPLLPEYKRRHRTLSPPAGMKTQSGEPAYKIEGGQAEFSGVPSLVWSHVLANENFGYLACDSGAGNLWYKNAQENRITPWLNDPLAGEGPEEIEVVSLHTRRSLFSRGEGGFVRFSPGVAEWYTQGDGLSAHMTAFVHPTLAARVMLIELSGEKAPHADIFWRMALQIGPNACDAHTVRTDFDRESGMISAENPAARRYGIFRFSAHSFPRAQGFTCDLDAARADDFDGACGAGYAPCIALSVKPEKDGESYRAVLVCGCSENEEERARLASLCTIPSAQKALEETKRYWESLCMDVRAETGNARIDAYLNGFSPYQVIAGRLFARHSMYQSSGAYGFRDQLQDVCALLALPPEKTRYALVRAQILRAAAHQYREGDVQHWWHADADKTHARGVRTRVSDDLLFLPYAALLYAETSGDAAFWEEPAPWLDSPVLRQDEIERLETAPVSQDTDPVWAHCTRALDRVLSRGTGAHGLARIGGGDWNDAMNAVGVEGKGESVWLSWFAALVFSRMAQAASSRAETEKAALWRQFAEDLRASALDAWDGDHFLRGWHDDGTPIGAQANDACRIDAISQAFAVFAGPPQGMETLWRRRTETALDRAVHDLYDGRIVRLFAPPFTAASKQDPGYIKGYPPGVRENGGQYTHGAVWLAMALARFGRAEVAAKMLASLAPSGREGYLAEPYYLAGDVCAEGALYGRAGWTIYTGAAGWYLRAVLTELLGLHFSKDTLTVTPRLPASWPDFRVTIHADGKCVRILRSRRESGDPAPLSIPWPPNADKTIEI